MSKICYCGFAYDGLCDAYNRKGLNRGNVKPSILKQHQKSGKHQRYINSYEKKSKAVIRQLNCIIKNLFGKETLLCAVLKNKKYNKNK